MQTELYYSYVNKKEEQASKFSNKKLVQLLQIICDVYILF